MGAYSKGEAEMRIIVVDDEPLALGGLVDEIKKAQPDCSMQSYTDPVAALEAVGGNAFTPDVAFLDIEMPGLSGISLAKRFKDACPKINIIFVTSYSRYALDAHSMHASGYLMKPVVAPDIRRELDDLRTPVFVASSRVRIQTFGNFDIFVDNTPLHFARSQAKEAFAYIVSRNGGSVTAAELAAVIWEEVKDYSRSMQNQIQTVISNMMKTLRQAGAADIIIKRQNSISLDVTKVDCDYYRFLKGDIDAVNAYMGEFMNNYSWAEMITGYLSNKH
jgi:two-component system LytT family response regulator